ncbi:MULTISPECIES: hypothetical protein [unclassified Bradyrhizobium]|uniref:hypothetical protein n=1 Tax=unclassified Bradyrhizobium TaxID=2631580 RepID=UPI001FF835EE|nr:MULTISPECIES: hypothetical protein [unclassified Bradyrhizobium]UPK19184.1 hypothetical protein IVA73_35085 [Bradyrhizobium sp. 131]
MDDLRRRQARNGAAVPLNILVVLERSGIARVRLLASNLAAQIALAPGLEEAGPSGKI